MVALTVVVVIVVVVVEIVVVVVVVVVVLVVEIVVVVVVNKQNIHVLWLEVQMHYLKELWIQVIHLRARVFQIEVMLKS